MIFTLIGLFFSSPWDWMVGGVKYKTVYFVFFLFDSVAAAEQQKSL